MAKNNDSYGQRRVGIHNLITYSPDGQKTGVSSKLEPKTGPFGGKFPLLSTIAAAGVITAGVVTWGLFSKDDSPSIQRCSHAAMAEHDYEYNNWRRKIANTVWDKEGEEAKEALKKLIYEKEQINQKFQVALEACTVLPE